MVIPSRQSAAPHRALSLSYPMLKSSSNIVFALSSHLTAPFDICHWPVHIIYALLSRMAHHIECLLLRCAPVDHPMPRSYIPTSTFVHSHVHRPSQPCLSIVSNIIPVVTILCLPFPLSSHYHSASTQHLNARPLFNRPHRHEQPFSRLLPYQHRRVSAVYRSLPCHYL
jgi:hypothetical protein